MVTETPRHRQCSRLALQREHVTKQLSTSGPPDVQVIAESPIKQSKFLIGLIHRKCGCVFEHVCV